jgi:putative glycosyltransferase
VTLSIVTTLYCSAPHLQEFYRRARAAAETITTDYEIVFVHDGSPDDSLFIALELFERDPRVRVVDLARNFGHHKAMMTGLRHARGKLVFLIDSDLEEDPELLTAFAATLDTAAADVDVVYGVQQERRGNWFERWSGRIFFSLFNLMSDYPIPENLLTVRLMTRRYVSALLSHGEREMAIAGLWVLTGFQQVPIAVTKHSRSKTTYSLRRKIAVLVNSVTSFSSRPLVFIFYLGVAIGALAAAAAVYLVIRRVFFDILLQGWPSLIVSLWLLGGMILACLGIIGIYLSKIFIETKQRPYTIVRSVHERTADPAEPRNPRDGRPLLF